VRRRVVVAVLLLLESYINVRGLCRGPLGREGLGAVGGCCAQPAGDYSQCEGVELSCSGRRGKTCTAVARNTVVPNTSYIVSCWHFHNADTEVASSLPGATTSKPYGVPSAGWSNGGRVGSGGAGERVCRGHRGRVGCCAQPTGFHCQW
jgi:hypothetical protein